MTDPLPNLILLIIAILAIGQIAMAIYIGVSEKQFLAELGRALGLPEKQRKMWGLWHQNMKKAQNVLSAAELEGVKVVADTKYYTGKLEGAYEDQMRLSTAHMEREFKKVVDAAELEFGKSLATLTQQSGKLVDDAMTAFTKRLEQKLTEVEQLSLKQGNEELEKTKADVAAYKKAMLDKAKTDMVEIMAEVGQKVLGRKLSVFDQVDLINEALEQAKKEKFIS